MKLKKTLNSSSVSIKSCKGGWRRESHMELKEYLHYQLKNKDCLSKECKTIVEGCI